MTVEKVKTNEAVLFGRLVDSSGVTSTTLKISVDHAQRYPSLSMHKWQWPFTFPIVVDNSKALLAFVTGGSALSSRFCNESHYHLNQHVFLYFLWRQRILLRVTLRKVISRQFCGDSRFVKDWSIDIFLSFGSKISLPGIDSVNKSIVERDLSQEFCVFLCR